MLPRPFQLSGGFVTTTSNLPDDGCPDNLQRTKAAGRTKPAWAWSARVAMTGRAEIPAALSPKSNLLAACINNKMLGLCWCESARASRNGGRASQPTTATRSAAQIFIHQQDTWRRRVICKYLGFYEKCISRETLLGHWLFMLVLLAGWMILDA